MRVLQLHDRTLVHCTLRASTEGIRIVCTGPLALTPEQRHQTASQLRTCLRFDEDFAPFHAVMRKHPAYRWIARRRAGRLLRAPTMFEDTVKMICPTSTGG
jgi:N-glycosylase/DNA lyase